MAEKITKKPTLIVYKVDLLEWFYDNDKKISLADNVIDDLADSGVFTITLKDIFENVGYIPYRFIKNAKELGIDEEDGCEYPSFDYDVEWL